MDTLTRSVVITTCARDRAASKRCAPARIRRMRHKSCTRVHTADTFTSMTMCGLIAGQALSIQRGRYEATARTRRNNGKSKCDYRCPTSRRHSRAAALALVALRPRRALCCRVKDFAGARDRMSAVKERETTFQITCCSFHAHSRSAAACTTPFSTRRAQTSAPLGRRLRTSARAHRTARARL